MYQFKFQISVTEEFKDIQNEIIEFWKYFQLIKIMRTILVEFTSKHTL